MAGAVMPLDRPIIIGIRGPDDTNAAGQHVPGVAVEYPVFATAIDISVARTLETGGARLDSDRVFRVRWFEELALAPVTSIELTDELGLEYTVTNVSEYVGRFGDHRRRWLDIECSREAQTRR